MTTELTKAAQQAVETLQLARNYILQPIVSRPEGIADKCLEALECLYKALTQRHAAQTEDEVDGVPDHLWPRIIKGCVDNAEKRRASLPAPQQATHTLADTLRNIDAASCKDCAATGYSDPGVPDSPDGPGRPAVVCGSCNGNGWRDGVHVSDQQATPEPLKLSDEWHERAFQAAKAYVNKGDKETRTACFIAGAMWSATPEPVPAEQAKWCEYVAGMVDCWVSAEWSHYNHMDEDRRVKAIAGIIERRLWALQKRAATPDPIPMVLHCPKCGMQHIDAPESGDVDDGHVTSYGWDNPPHRSHLCHACSTIWRPADVPTTGVKAIGTKGKADTWEPGQAATPEPVGEPFGWWFTEDPEVFSMPGSGFRRYPNKPQHTVECIPLYTRPAPGVPAKLPSAYATSTEDGAWRVLLAFDNKDDAEATRRFLHDHGVQPRTMRSSAPGVPEGFALVQSPITEAMHEAACKVLTRATGLDGLPQRMLDALAAAQAKGGEHG